MNSPEQPVGGKIAVCAAAFLVTAALVWYACTDAFAADEGYHLIAAWLIAHGRKPYIDFLFPQTPLNAYWNAFLLRVFGESWRVPHTAAALLTGASAAVVARHVYRRMPDTWRVPAAIVVLVTIGFNTAVVEFGSLQAYGLCLFMIVSAYCLTVRAAEKALILIPFLAGLCAGVAASSSLLTAPIGPVLLIWLLIVSRTGSRFARCAAFLAGELTAFIPLLLLLIRSPHQVIFGFLQYQLLYRKVEWDDAFNHNLGEILSWGDSSQAVLLVLLAAAGILFVRRKQEWRAIRKEIYLCGCLAVIEGVYLMTPRPTFTRYYLLTVPFLAIAAAPGLCEITERLFAHAKPGVNKAAIAAGILCAITSYGLGAAIFEQRDDFMWPDAEKTADKVREVTPATAPLLADEVVYFLLHRAPPSGMELEDSHKLKFSDAEANLLHIVPRPKLDRMIQTGQFATVEMCDSDEVDRLKLSTLFEKNASAGSCQVFWQFSPSSAQLRPPDAATQ